MIIQGIAYFLLFSFLYMTILFFLKFLEEKNEIYKSKIKKNHPYVCIAVPCFNEEKTIIRTIHSLLRLNYPKDKLEIFIIDDGSTDRTLEKAKSLEKYEQVKVFHKKNGGKWTALNYGILKTDAEFFGCLDADSFVNSDALELIISYFSNPKVMAVTSSVKIDKPINILQRIQKIEFIIGVFLRKILCMFDSLTVTPGPFTFFRKSIFNEIGLFRHGHNTEDFEIALRIQSKNYQIANASNASVYTVGPTSFTELYKQRKRWYYGGVKNILDYKFLLFNKKYGDLGFFFLPIMILSILALLIINSYAIFQLTKNLIQGFIMWEMTNFNINQLNFHFDWFFINTQLHTILFALLLSAPLIFILLGKKMSFEKSKIKKDLLFFIPFYGVLYFIWWLGTVKDVLLNKKNKW